MNHLKIRLAIIALGVVAVALICVTINRVPLPWVDEVILASGSHSLLYDGTGVPTYAFDRTQMIPIQLFYGPVFPTCTAISFKLLGYSMGVFRMLSLLGAIMLAVGCAVLVRSLGGSQLRAAICFTMVALSVEVGSHASAGRMDTLTVAFQILGLWLLLKAWQKSGAATAVRAGSAGVIWALALLSTPRSFPFFLALTCSAVLLIRFPRALRARALLSLVGAGAVAGVLTTAWTFSVQMNPVMWLRFIAQVSSGDQWNSSPLLGGSWVLQLSPQGLVTPVVLLAILLILVVWASVQEWQWTFSDPLFLFVLVALVTSAALTLLLISRPLSYATYWALPLLPVAIVATPSFTPQRGQHTVWLVYGLWVSLAMSYVGIRVIKYGELLGSWQARDPQTINSFVRTYIQPGSRVYGPWSYYYWAVEGAGSRYVSAERWQGGKAAATVLPSEVQRQLKALLKGRARESYDSSVNGAASVSEFLIWPDDQTLPAGFSCAGENVLARYKPLASGSSWIARLHPGGGGYPATTIYQLAPGCAPQ